MVKLIQIGFLTGALVFSVWAAEDTSSVSEKNEVTEEYVGENTEERTDENVDENTKEKTDENVKEEVNTEAEGVGKCPHCGPETADVDREENTNPGAVAAQVSQPSKSKKPPKPPKPSTDGADAIR